MRRDAWSLLLVTPVALAAESTPFDEMIAAERAFAARSVATNAQTAFLEYLSADSLAFQPDPRMAVELQRQRPEPTFTLDWAPALGGIAASGDLGWTTGPWRITAAGQPPRGGHFFSVWQRDAHGRFRNVLDQGVHHALLPLATTVERVGPVARASAPRLDPAATNDRLQALVLADRALARALATPDGAAAYRAAFADDALMLRNGAAPRPARDAVAAFAPLPPMELGTVRVAAAGDLGATGGWSGPADDAKAYTRVWRWDARAWKLAVDVLVERPPPATP